MIKYIWTLWHDPDFKSSVFQSNGQIFCLAAFLFRLSHSFNWLLSTNSIYTTRKTTLYRFSYIHIFWMICDPNWNIHSPKYRVTSGLNQIENKQTIVLLMLPFLNMIFRERCCLLWNLLRIQLLELFIQLRYTYTYTRYNISQQTDCI